MDRLKLAFAIGLLGIVASFYTSCTGPEASSPALTAPLAEVFWLEPAGKTVIGVGQTFNIFSALKLNTSDPYPAYVDPTLITWSSSQSAIASVSAEGVVAGNGEGTSTITATYLNYSKSLTVQVSGTMTKRTVTVLGQGSRDYYIYVPPFSGAPGPHPLLLSLHGGGGSAMEQAAKTQINKLAYERKFFVAYPEGTGVIKTFNGGACCGSAQTNNVNDVLYVRKLLDDVEASYDINTAKIYSTGFSNGGIMSHRLACELADRISGVAPVGGGPGQFDFDSKPYYVCNPSRPIPVLHIHYTNDRNYPFNGGYGGGVSATNYYPVPSAITDWVTRNNLTDQASIEVLTPTTKCYRYTTPADIGLPNAPVTLCVADPIDVYDPVSEIVFGGGHSWPGGVRSIGSNSDVPSMDFNANSYIWNFLNN